jgi:hypothetical protein
MWVGISGRRGYADDCTFVGSRTPFGVPRLRGDDGVLGWGLPLFEVPRLRGDDGVLGWGLPLFEVPRLRGDDGVLGWGVPLFEVPRLRGDDGVLGWGWRCWGLYCFCSWLDLSNPLRFMHAGGN